MRSFDAYLHGSLSLFDWSSAWPHWPALTPELQARVAKMLRVMNFEPARNSDGRRVFVRKEVA